MVAHAGFGWLKATAEAESELRPGDGGSGVDPSEGADVAASLSDASSSILDRSIDEFTNDVEGATYGSSLIGNVEGRQCMLVDDMIDSAAPFIRAAEL